MQGLYEQAYGFNDDERTQQVVHHSALDLVLNFFGTPAGIEFSPSPDVHFPWWVGSTFVDLDAGIPKDYDEYVKKTQAQFDWGYAQTLRSLRDPKGARLEVLRQLPK